MSTPTSDALRRGATVEMRLAAARRDGELTARARGAYVNPWRGDADTAVERLLAVWWARGYTAGNPLSS